MKRISNLTLAIAVALGATATAFGDVQKPDLLFPTYQNGSVIHGLSNNGKYGVASITTDEGGNTFDIGALLYDLTKTPLEPTVLSSGRDYAEANDVTDDGKTVAGSVNNKPAVCRFVDGKWVWETLPLPTEKVTLTERDPHSGQVYTTTYSLNTGTIKAITPDGKYAVGSATSADNIMIETGVMWDVENKAIIPLDGCSRLNVFDEDDNQSRFLQLSDDGRYILGLNSFSYADNRGDYTLHYIYDRQENKQIFPFYNTVGKYKVPRLKGYDEMEIDYTKSKSLTSNGRYFTGRLTKGNQSYTFLFDVFNDNLEVFDDGVHDDTYGWCVSKDGLVLSATPAVNPYADALIYYNTYMYPVEALYKDVYGINPWSYGIDNTGKPTLISEDAQTVVFVTEKDKSYVARFHEPLTQALERINLMSEWSVYPPNNTKMTNMTDVTLTFTNMIDMHQDKVGDIKLLDADGAEVATASKANVDNMRLTISFPQTKLAENKTYTVVIPAGVAFVKGIAENANEELRFNYTGRADVPVKLTSISPAPGTALPNLDLNDNPVVVSFDSPIMMNLNGSDRPMADIYVDDNTQSSAGLYLDVDKNTYKLIIFPMSTFNMYKGGKYRIEVPAGAVVDLSGAGPSEAFTINYDGSFVPQMGSDKTLFESGCDSFEQFLFYEGDHGEPVSEYAEMSFTADTTPWWVVMDSELNPDMAFASHSVYKDGRQANDWVTTRQILMPDDVDCYLTFQSQSYRKAKEDYLKVYIYENNVTLNALSSNIIEDILENGDLVYNKKQDPGASEDLMAGEWTDNVIDLAPYKGKSIYICWLNDNQNQSMVMIDNIAVVKNVDATITITGSSDVVNATSAPVKGMLAIQSELSDFKTLNMTLKDSEGKEISKISESGLSLKGGDIYNFQFNNELPLKVGVENAYTIEYTLDDSSASYSGVIRNLAFRPEKRVVIEEFSGRDCSNCPLGIAAMERLESLYGDQVIPVVLHCYNGSDPKGANISDYAYSVFMGNGSAPNGRIQRRPYLSAPMYSDQNGKFHMTAADVPGTANVWQDDVVEELGEASYLDLTVTPKVSGGVAYDVTVKSALNLENQNIRLLGVLLEDGLIDRQSNGLYTQSDELLGEFGRGGTYGKSTFYYEFNNVARGYWGQSSNGTPRLFPTTFEVGKDYTAEIVYDIPAIVENPDKLKMVVMLIDENTGKVVNAAVSKADVTSVEEIFDETEVDIVIAKIGGDIVVNGVDDLQVAVYSLDGRMLKNAYGNGEVTVNLDGYKGLVIVRAAASGKTATVKLMM